MSIQQAYTVILNDAEALNRYRTYRHLKLIGYKLHKCEKPIKRQLDDKTESENKRAFLENATETSVSSTVSSTIAQDAPVQFQNTETALMDYKVRFPESTNKDDEAFYLYIKYVVVGLFLRRLIYFLFSKTNTFDDCLKISDKNGPVITAVTSEDDVCFYRFSSVDLPILL